MDIPVILKLKHKGEKQMAQPMKCAILSTGEEVGYLSTYNANVSLVKDRHSDEVAQVYWTQKGTQSCLAKETEPTERWLGPGYPEEGSTAVWGLGKNYCYLDYNKSDGTITTISEEKERLMLYWDGSYVRWGKQNQNTIGCKLD
jgi:hypothetical protein